jgi:hypothetical protein
MYGPEVIVNEGDVPASDLDRRWTVAEDALKAEYIAAVGEERPRKRVAQDVRRAARLQSRPGGETVHELIETPRGQSVTARTSEEWIVDTDTVPMAQPGPDGLASSSTDGNQSLLTTLPEHTAPTFNEVQITDPE